MAAISLTSRPGEIRNGDRHPIRHGRYPPGHPWVAALVEKYAPGAPSGVKLEAAMRCLGWWTQSPAWPVSSQKLGETSVDYALHKLNPLLHSGASMILSPFRTNTMGVV